MTTETMNTTSTVSASPNVDPSSSLGPYARIGREFYTVGVADTTSERYVVVCGSRWGTRVDSPTWPNGQVFTSAEAARNGSWLIRCNASRQKPRELLIVRVRYLGGDLFERLAEPDIEVTDVPV